MSRLLIFEGGSAPAFAFVEKFEGSETDSQSVSGYDNTGWTSNNVANNPNYATAPAPLEGTYSMWFGNAARYIERSFSSVQATQTLAGVFNWGGTYGTFGTWIGLYDSISTLVARIETRASGEMRVNHGSATGGTASGYATGTSYYWWLEYTTGTGSDGVANLYTNTTNSRSGATLASQTTVGTATTNATSFRINGLSNSGIHDFIIDNGGSTIGDIA